MAIMLLTRAVPPPLQVQVHILVPPLQVWLQRYQLFHVDQETLDPPPEEEFPCSILYR